MQEKVPQFGGKVEMKEKPIKRLEGFIEEMSLALKKEGIPVNEKGRIDMRQFCPRPYPEGTLNTDRGYVDCLKENFDRDTTNTIKQGIFSKEWILSQRTTGEIWEMLATAILHKKLGGDFIVVRASEYDDIGNGIDSVILYRRTGTIVCAFDEVGDIEGPRFEEKKRKIFGKNLNWQVTEGGGVLKYGISFEKNKQGKVEFKKGLLNHIPLFYLAIPKKMVERCLEGFSSEGTTTEEEEIFKIFINSCSQQIGDLKKRERSLPWELKQRLESFGAIINELKNVVK